MTRAIRAKGFEGLIDKPGINRLVEVLLNLYDEVAAHYPPDQPLCVTFHESSIYIMAYNPAIVEAGSRDTSD